MSVAHAHNTRPQGQDRREELEESRGCLSDGWRLAAWGQAICSIAAASWASTNANLALRRSDLKVFCGSLSLRFAASLPLADSFPLPSLCLRCWGSIDTVTSSLVFYASWMITASSCYSRRSCMMHCGVCSICCGLSSTSLITLPSLFLDACSPFSLSSWLASESVCVSATCENLPLDTKLAYSANLTSWLVCLRIPCI